MLTIVHVAITVVRIFKFTSIAFLPNSLPNLPNLLNAVTKFRNCNSTEELHNICTCVETYKFSNYVDNISKICTTYICIYIRNLH